MRSGDGPAGLAPGRRLTAVLWIGLVPLFLTGGSAPSEHRCPGKYLGVWEYRQRAGDGYDIEGERIEITCVGGSMRGLYSGLEREGEHGLFYTLVEVPDLKVTPSGTLTFTVAERLR